VIIIAILLAYLLGSFNSAITICKLAKFPDPRGIGSGNPGATNMLRIGGKSWAALVLVIDALKGTVAVLIAKLFGVELAHQVWVLLAAVVGHMYPLYYRFEGGKGVATAWGGMLAINWILGLFALVCWIAVAAWTRYSALAALVTTFVIPFMAAWSLGSGAFLGALIISGLIYYRHKTNISRLWRGEEDKLDFRGKS
jgi:glycerol-3-phosphate acyltransferase PlsY